MTNLNYNLDLAKQIRDLLKSIEIERKHYYCDFQGKKLIFSKYFRQTLAKLCSLNVFVDDFMELRGLMRHYSQYDVSTRINTLNKVLARLNKIEAIISGNNESIKNIGIYENENIAIEKPNDSTQTLSKTQTDYDTRSLKDIQNILQQDIKYLKGVGPKMAKVLENLEIFKISDVLRHYPKSYIDFKAKKNICDLKDKEFATIIGTINYVSFFNSPKKNINIVTINIKDETGTISHVKFLAGGNYRYSLERIKSQYTKGARVMVSGQIEFDEYKHKLFFKTAQFEILSKEPNSGSFNFSSLTIDNLDGTSLNVGRIVPIYSLTEGLSLNYFRAIVHRVLELIKDKCVDSLDNEILQEFNLVDYSWAIRQIHFPDSLDNANKARERLVFDELLALQLRLMKKRQEQKHYVKDVRFKYYKQGLCQELIKSLPFELTKAQMRVFNEIVRDMSDEKPMYRLVQGDVGSGKTIVSLLSQLVAIENGYQTALMAPTEILARQHYNQFVQLLMPLGLKVALLIGKTTTKEKRNLKQDLLNGLINIVVGTHALIEDDIEFNNLGLIVIDEQHRFGVKQRYLLKSKAKYPELLTMTATPIPRSLALTLHGDLDISEIDELPPNRTPVETFLIKSHSEKKKMYEFIGKQIILGRQAYIVFPLIEESETISAKAATIEYENLKANIFPNFNVGLMHGKLSSQEKEQVMSDFRAKKIDILVSTTVIEVGVDVPNATIMVIENANRFGLAQLHQLRGRVGRGSEKSYCFLSGEVKNEVALARLDIMTQTNDGFVIAQKDLEIRGPGEFLGIRQSGLPDLCLTDLAKDAKILTHARQLALRLVQEDPQLKKYPQLYTIMNSNLDQIDNLQSG